MAEELNNACSKRRKCICPLQHCSRAFTCISQYNIAHGTFLFWNCILQDLLSLNDCQQKDLPKLYDQTDPKEMLLGCYAVIMQ